MATEAQREAARRNIEKARAAREARRVEKEPDPSPAPPQPEPKPAAGPINLGLRPKVGLRPSGRTIKMLVPHCDICTAQGLFPNWWESCSHEPYMIDQEIPDRQRQTEQRGGETIVTGYEEKLVFSKIPRMYEVELTPRVNAGRSVDRWRARGAILPEDYRSPDAPQGYAPFCQYRECWSQDIRHRTPYGDYCRADQAQHVALDETGNEGNPVGGKRLEVLNEGKRQSQLAELKV